MVGRVGAGRVAMFSVLFAFLRSLLAAVQTHRHLVLENLALRHQLLVLNRTVKAPALRNSDRLFRAALGTMWSRWTKVLVIVQPQTVVRWHQAGFRLFWRWKSRCRTGRAPTDRDWIELDSPRRSSDPIYRASRQESAERRASLGNVHRLLPLGFQMEFLSPTGMSLR